MASVHREQLGTDLDNKESYEDKENCEVFERRSKKAISQLHSHHNRLNSQHNVHNVMLWICDVNGVRCVVNCVGYDVNLFVMWPLGAPVVHWIYTRKK